MGKVQNSRLAFLLIKWSSILKYLTIEPITRKPTNFIKQNID